VMQYQPFEDGYKQLVGILNKYVDRFAKDDKFHMAGYNCQAFDGQFLRGLFLQNDDNYFGSWFWPNTIDVYVIAGEYFMTERHTFKDFKLKTVAARLNIPVDETRLHDGDYDIELTQQIYYRVKGLEAEGILATMREA